MAAARLQEPRPTPGPGPAHKPAPPPRLAPPPASRAPLTSLGRRARGGAQAAGTRREGRGPSVPRPAGRAPVPTPPPRLSPAHTAHAKTLSRREGWVRGWGLRARAGRGARGARPSESGSACAGARGRARGVRTGRGPGAVFERPAGLRRRPGGGERTGPWLPPRFRGCEERGGSAAGGVCRPRPAPIPSETVGGSSVPSGARFPPGQLPPEGLGSGGRSGGAFCVPGRG